MLTARGSAAVEYAIIGTTLAVLCLFTLQKLGGNINTVLGKSADLSGTFSLSSAAIDSQGGTSSGASGGSGSVSGQSGVIAPSVDLVKSVETLGTNGTSALLAGDLVQYGKQLLDAHGITQENYNAIVELANQGHRIAQIEALIDEHIASSYQHSEDKTIAWDGGLYSLGDLANMVGWNNDLNIYDPTSFNIAAQAGINPETDKFLTLQTQVLSSLESLQPDAKSAIFELGNGILLLSETTQGNTYDIILGKRPLSERSGDLVNAVAHYLESNTAIATQTDDNAAGICTTGNAQDSGQSCQ
jgi:Flp pilus assembly pilin Flp